MDKSKERDELTGTEGQGQSNPETSGQEGGQTSSRDTLSVEQLLQNETASKLIGELVEEGVRKEFQKNKDKRLQQVDENKTRLDKIEERMEAGESFGEAKAQVLKEERDLEIEQKLNSLLESGAGGGADTPKTWTEREAAILGGQVEVTNPELVRFKRQFDSPEEYLQALPEKLWQMQGSPKGDTGSASGGTGSQVQTDLQAEYNEKVAALPKPVAPHVLADLKAEYRKKGLPVY